MFSSRNIDLRAELEARCEDRMAARLEGLVAWPYDYMD